jgi:hypothetical protein
MNKTIKKILEEALGVTPRGRDSHFDEFEKFCGIWSKIDVKDFEKRISALCENKSFPSFLITGVGNSVGSP